MIVSPRSRPSAFIPRGGRAVALLLAATLAVGASLALGAVRAGKYSGKTSEGGPVTLTIAPAKKTIAHFKAILAYNGKCGQGGGPGLTAAPASISIGAGGSFTKNVTLSLGNVVHDPGRVFGKVSGSKVTGTIEQLLHGKVNKCYVETFTAHRR